MVRQGHPELPIPEVAEDCKLADGRWGFRSLFCTVMMAWSWLVTVGRVTG